MKKITLLSLLASSCLITVSSYAAEEVKETSEKITILTCNVCTTKNRLYNIYNDSNHPELHPHARLPRITALIKQHSPDIVCFQECHREEAQLISKQLKEKYDTIAIPLNGTQLANYFVTAYNKSKLLPEQNMQRWLVGEEGSSQCTGNQWCKWGRLLTGTTFAFIKNGMPDNKRNRLHVFNTHLGLNSEEKMVTTQELVTVINDYLRSNADTDPIVLCGDFNTFMDKDGAQQRKIVTDAGFIDALADNIESLTKHKVSGTFIGYSTDPGLVPQFNAETLGTYTMDNAQLLDGIFVRNAQVEDHAIALTDHINGKEITEEVLFDNRDGAASDHLPILSTLVV